MLMMKTGRISVDGTVHELKDLARSRRYRADHPISKTCAAGDQKTHDIWLGNHQWRILEIKKAGVIVMNACGNEETLGAEIRVLPPQPPEHTVEVEESNFGAGTVELFDACKRVVFLSRNSSDVREYRLETWKQPGSEGMTVYVPQQGEKIPQSPLDLSALLRVHLQGEKCGQKVEIAPPEAEEPFPF
jgi:hypothetical protein